MSEGQMSALAKQQVPIKLSRQPLIQLQRSIVKRNALRSAIVRAQNCGVTPAGAGTQVALFEQSDLSYAVFLAEIVCGGQPMYAGANDYHIVAGAQFVLSPHPIFAEQLHGSVPQQFQRPQTEGLQMKFVPGVDDGLPC